MNFKNLFQKNCYRYELRQRENISEASISNADDLINFIVSENTRLLDSKEDGSVLLVKLKKLKNTEQILYAQKLSLPIQGEGAFFDHFLSSFYTKKKMPFDLKILEEDTQKVSDVPPLPEELEKMLTQQAVDVSESENSLDEHQMILEQNNQLLKEIEQIKAENQALKEKDTPSEGSLPETGMLETEQVLEKLCKESSDISSILSPTTIVDEREEPISHVSDEQSMLSIDTLYSQTDTDSVVLFTDEMIQETLEKAKQGFKQRLSEFIDQEKSKIESEIKTLDKREQIAPTIYKQHDQEKQKSLNELEIENEKLFNQAIEQENERHQNALKEIKQNYEAQLSDSIAKIEHSYQVMAQQKIKEEYEKQTNQLNQILQGKVNELALRKKEMNERLQTDFAQVLSQFNQNHDNVIKLLEKKQEKSKLKNVPKSS